MKNVFINFSYYFFQVFMFFLVVGMILLIMFFFYLNILILFQKIFINFGLIYYLSVDKLFGEKVLLYLLFSVVECVLVVYEWKLIIGNLGYYESVIMGWEDYMLIMCIG